MSNVINFNAREFSVDNGKRLIVTGIDGKNVELHEIGKDYYTSYTSCEKQLEPNTDYVFRFAMIGGYEENAKSVSELNISLTDTWSDSYTYELLKSRFKPIISTRDEEKKLLRVYEIPFTTNETGKVKIKFVAYDVATRIMPALENEAYINKDNKSSQISKIEVSEVAKFTLNEKATDSDADIQVTVVDKEEADALKNAIENALENNIP